MTTIRAVFCNVMAAGGVAYTMTELLDAMAAGGGDLAVWFPQGEPKVARNYHRPVFNRQVWRVVCKMGAAPTLGARVVTRAALRGIRAGDLVYVWPPASIALVAGARERGAIVVGERINCMPGMCRAALERAYAHVGRPLPAGCFSAQAVAREEAEMALCDYLTAPNSLVTQSLLDAGIAPSRILETSYGWSPQRLAAAADLRRPERKPVFAFVGLGIIRKGLNLLLEAWERARVDGRLVIAGTIADEIREVSARQLALPGVEELGFVADVARVYAAADVFAFPTHEEGGPQVVYEAAGCGLPCLVSPMGAGRVVRDGVEGYVIDPFDVDGWARAIHALATNAHLRQSLGDAAARRAQAFTWDRVGRRLHDLLVGAAGRGPVAPGAGPSPAGRRA